MSERTQVLIVGGGIVGAASAYYLAKAGVEVTLLEAETLAYGATGRNLGFIWVHTRKKGPELELVMATRSRLESLVDELGEDVHLRTNGGMVYFWEEGQAAIMREFVEHRRQDGVHLELLTGDEARRRAPILPATVLGATYCALDAQVEPTLWVRAFASAAARHGAVIREGVRVSSLRREGDRIVGADTCEGTFEAETVVLAAGGWSSELAATVNVDLGVLPMRLQIVQTQPMEIQTGPVLYGATALKQYAVFQDLPSFDDSLFMNDVEWRNDMLLLESFCQKMDGSYLMGCSMDYPGNVWESDLRGISTVSDIIMDHIPAFRDARFAKAWAGVLPFTVDNLPIIDRAPGIDGLVIAAGHVFGNGAGPTTGSLVASILTDTEPIISLDPFRADRVGLALAAEQSTW